jgi:hypothetical protein
MRFRDIKMLMEGARIQHAEDIIFWEGSKGALRVVNSLKSLEQSGHKEVTIKWDGSPAVIFGRAPDGRFVFTDKSGWSAKGYNGKTTSADEVRNMFLSRSSGARREDPAQIEFANSMADLFNQFELIVPNDYSGFFKGDLLYTETPPVVKNNFVFKPNIVEYAVDVESELGQKIRPSNAGIVIHRQIDEEGNETPLEQYDIFTGNNVLVVAPVSVEQPAQKISPALNKLEVLVNKNASLIDELLSKTELSMLRMTDFPQILYRYINSKVDTGLSGLGADFGQWLQASTVSDVKKQKMADYIDKHKQAWSALWQTVSAIMQVKDNIISQFENQGGDVQQNIPGHTTNSGEGYVLAHPEGDIKLVPRSTFSAANRAAVR